MIKKKMFMSLSGVLILQTLWINFSSLRCLRVRFNQNIDVFVVGTRATGYIVLILIGTSPKKLAQFFINLMFC